MTTILKHAVIFMRLTNSVSNFNGRSQKYSGKDSGVPENKIHNYHGVDKFSPILFFTKDFEKYITVYN